LICLPRSIWLFAISAALVAAAILLGFAVSAGWFREFDLAVSHALNLRAGTSPDWLILVMQAISWIGGGVQRYIMVTLLTLALWRYWGWGAGLAMGLTSLASSVVSDVFKYYFARLRPDLVPHLDPIGSFAYTSGHSVSASTVYLLFIFLMPGKAHRLWQIGVGTLILLTGLSRVMLGVHWPTDVVGGWMLGTAFATSTYAIIIFIEESKNGLRLT
jgi:undecaprenyl-diphosphatase